LPFQLVKLINNKNNTTILPKEKGKEKEKGKQLNKSVEINGSSAKKKKN